VRIARRHRYFGVTEKMLDGYNIDARTNQSEFLLTAALCEIPSSNPEVVA
jgi:hypothetical protein